MAINTSVSIEMATIVDKAPIPAESGNKYVGEFRDGKFRGQGTYTYGPKSPWAGDKYVGEYKNNKRDGQGKYIYSNGKIEEGIWRDDEFQFAAKSSPFNQKNNIVDYSLLLEEEGSTIMCISQLSDGSRVANINVLGGYKWFEKTFQNSTATQVFINLSV